MKRRLASVIVLVAALAPGLAEAAPEPPPPGDVRALTERVAALEHALAELPSALEALHELENRLHALERRLEASSGERDANAEVRRAIDELREQASALEHRLHGGEARAPAEAAEPASSPPGEPNPEEEGGVVLRNRFIEARLSGGVQARLTGVLLRETLADRASFDVHHAELDFEATLLGFLAVSVGLDFGTEYITQGTDWLRELAVTARPLPWLWLRAGEILMPFSRQRLIGPLHQTFIERSVATRLFAPESDLGLMAGARFLDGKLTVEAAVTDGIDGGRQLVDDNRDLAYTLRLTTEPLGPLPLGEGTRVRAPAPRLLVGGAFQYNLVPVEQPAPLDDLDHNGVRDNVEVIEGNAQLALHVYGVAVEAEYFLQHERLGFGRPPRTLHGVYGQVSALAWAASHGRAERLGLALEVGARVSYADGELLAKFAPPLGLRGDEPKRLLEASAVVNLYAWEERAKAQLSYTFRRDQPDDPFEAPERLGHVLELQAQLGF